MSDKKLITFKIWAKGYEGTKEAPVDVHLANVEASSFKEACATLASNDANFRKEFDPDKMTVRGCELFTGDRN